MKTHICILLLFSIYSLIEGYREAYFYHSARIFLVKNLHPIFLLQRIIVSSGMLMFILYKQSELWCIAVYFGLLISLGAIFPLLHDGMYYLTRNNIDRNIYKKRFWDYADSDAIMDFNVTQRVILFIAGLFLYSGIVLFIIN